MRRNLSPIRMAWGLIVRFGCRMVELYRVLRTAGGAARELAPQLLKSGTSIGANLEEATGGQSKPDFVAKVCIALKEARETRYWLRVIGACDLLPRGAVSRDYQEANEIVAILTVIIRHARDAPDRR
jgi:four helix bundle protein